MSAGLAVLVQLVIDAMSTGPSGSGSPKTSPVSTAVAVAAVRYDAGTCDSDSRWWGRFGPAMLGSTMPRSRSMTSS